MTDKRINEIAEKHFEGTVIDKVSASTGELGEYPKRITTVGNFKAAIREALAEQREETEFNLHKIVVDAVCAYGAIKSIDRHSNGCAEFVNTWIHKNLDK